MSSPCQDQRTQRGTSTGGGQYLALSRGEAFVVLEVLQEQRPVRSRQDVGERVLILRGALRLTPRLDDIERYIGERALRVGSLIRPSEPDVDRIVRGNRGDAPSNELQLARYVARCGHERQDFMSTVTVLGSCRISSLGRPTEAARARRDAYIALSESDQVFDRVGLFRETHEADADKHRNASTAV